MGLTRAEQETTIRWDEEEQIVHIWSASPKTWRKMARLGVTPAREMARHGQPSGRFYLVPVAQFRWRLKSLAIGANRKGKPFGQAHA
jgi:hypothetical protein